MKQGSVVVGVDGSAGGESALAWATRYAALHRRPLLIVTGAGDVANGVELFGSVAVRHDRTAAARKVSDQAVAVAQRLMPDLDVSACTPLADAREALLERSAHAAIVVVGTRGRGPVRALLLGSVSEAVAAHASCAVAVVRPIGPADAQRAGHVVVAVDATENSAGALDVAFDLASTEARPLDVVHSWAVREPLIHGPMYDQRMEQMDEHELWLNEAMAGYAEKYPDVQTALHMPEGGAVRALVAMSKTAATLVLGSHPRTPVHSMAASVGRAVLEQAHCTVVVAR